MRKLLVFQHVPYEPLGTLDRQFRAAGFRIRYVNFHRQPDARPDVRRYHGLVVLGGPMAADAADRHPHLAVERGAIADAVGARIPVLGICLGAQLIAACLGGRTLRRAAREIGWVDVSPTDAGRADPLFSHFERQEKIFQWHSDTFTLPPGATHLVSSALCAHQAFSYGESVYGLQFHLEADGALIERWLRTPQYLAELAEGGGMTADDVHRQTLRFAHRSTALSTAVFGEFIRRFYAWRRRIALPSR
jgi:GMP synthase (glutamine-hydrolysing)